MNVRLMAGNGDRMNDDTSQVLRDSADPDGRIEELQRLIIGYQAASFDDRSAVWAILNKYATVIDELI